jgi:hypothetical protein
MASLVLALREQGRSAPAPIDDAPEAAADGRAATGELSVRITPGLHRDLLVAARAEAVGLDQLAGELLAGALARRGLRRPAPRRDAEEGAPAAGDAERRGAGDSAGNTRGRPGRDPDRDHDRDYDRGRRGRQGYTAIMEDKATFLEYVRGLEQRTGAPAGSGGGGPAGGAGGGQWRGGGRRGGRGRGGGGPRGSGGGGGGHGAGGTGGTGGSPGPGGDSDDEPGPR